MSSGSRVRGLDALRGLAIALVLLAHGFPSRLLGAGIVGVVVFFTLSGYLITGILLNEAERANRISLGRFYRNRALRLLPALVAMLCVFAVVEALTNRLGDRPQLARELALGLGYITDIPRFNRDVGIGLQHLWTLAVEEQFYVLWPLLLLLAFRRKLLNPLVIGVGAVFAATCTATVLHATRPDYVYVLPTTWASTLVIGAAATIQRDRVGSLLRGDRARRLSWAAFAVLIAIALDTGIGNATWFYIVGAPIVGLCTVILIARVLQLRAAPRALVPLVALGRISYAAYLWNLPITRWIAPRHDPSFAGGVAATALTIAAAALSWVLIEGRVARLKARLDARREETAVRELGASFGLTRP
jgi:peptidoglycan/LPS O-acetylase OafA/YrhL